MSTRALVANAKHERVNLFTPLTHTHTHTRAHTHTHTPHAHDAGLG